MSLNLRLLLIPPEPKRITTENSENLRGHRGKLNSLFSVFSVLFLCGSVVSSRYVFIHELAHTRHRNHSREFWQLVAAHVPDFRAKRKELQRLWNALEI